MKAFGSGNERIIFDSELSEQVFSFFFCRHRPGDIAVLLPSNSKEHIDRLIKALGWEEEAERLIVVRKKRRKDHQDEDEDDDDDDEIGEILSRVSNKGLGFTNTVRVLFGTLTFRSLCSLFSDPDSIPSHSPTSPLTLRSFLTHHLSPLSIPDLSFFHTLFTFSPPHLFNQLDQLPENPSGKGYDVNDGESLERSKLKEFITPGEGQDECFEYSGRVRRTKLEVLEEFGNTSKRIPVRFCVELLGWMNEREFSIASGAKVSWILLFKTILISYIVSDEFETLQEKIPSDFGFSSLSFQYLARRSIQTKFNSR